MSFMHLHRPAAPIWRAFSCSSVLQQRAHGLAQRACYSPLADTLSEASATGDAHKSCESLSDEANRSTESMEKSWARMELGSLRLHSTMRSLRKTLEDQGIDNALGKIALATKKYFTKQGFSVKDFEPEVILVPGDRIFVDFREMFVAERADGAAFFVTISEDSPLHRLNVDKRVETLQRLDSVLKDLREGGVPRKMKGEVAKDYLKQSKLFVGMGLQNMARVDVIGGEVVPPSVSKYAKEKGFWVAFVMGERCRITRPRKERKEEQQEETR